VGYEHRPGVIPLLIQRSDPHATRPSGFVSGSKFSKGKAPGNRVSLHLPLKGWSIGVDISPQEETTEPLANLVLEAGLLKLRDASGSTLFDLQVKKGSVKDVKYVDINVSSPFFVRRGQLLRPPAENCDLRAVDPVEPIRNGLCFCTGSRYVHIQTRHVSSFFFPFALILIPTPTSLRLL
jgi:hypothetical protein